VSASRQLSLADLECPPTREAEEASEPKAERERTAEQAAAIEARDPYVFVEAGAGTGKTGVLVERYCDAVAVAETGADAVLAFTFTEKAAGELRARVRAELRRRAAAANERGDAERARELRELARAPGAWMTTIHGFCRRLVAAHPLAAGVDPGFRVLDAPESDLLAERAFESAFDELLADPSPSRLALAAARRRPVLRDLVRGAHDELRSLGRERPSLEEIGEPDLAGAIRELAEAAEQALAETADAGNQNAAALRERIVAATRLPDEHLAGGTPDIDAVLGLVVDKGGAAFQGPAVNRYNRAVPRVVERLAADLYDALRDLVEIYGRHYAELKAERSGLDFEDLQLRAIALLRESTPIRDAYRERFTDILVDEFQDTNRLQVDLVELLRGPATRLFTVGDEFQSIYGFRHADVAVFRRERERATALPLSGNFRSVPGVLGPANALGEALLPGYRSLAAALADPPESGEGPATELLLVEKAGWEDEEVVLANRGELDAPADRVAEAAALARRLAELAVPVTDGGPGFARGEMVVLLRAFTHVTAYEEALERAGLRPLVIGGRGYWSQQQVEDMLCLLGVVANPLEDEALLGALAGPACAASPDALWLLRRATGRGRHLWPTIDRRFGPRAEREPDAAETEPGQAQEADPEREAELAKRREAEEAIAADDVERIRDFAARLARLRRRAPLEPLDSLVDETARAFGYDLAVLARDRGRRRWANVRKLMRLARAYEEANGRDLAGFVASMRSRAERDDREPEAQTEVEGHDGVRLMTVHNAKGLEFGVVAVADLGRDLGAGGFPPAFRARPADDGDGVRIGVRLARAGADSLRLFELEGLQAEATEEESAEDRRLAYVAATRAERHLILSGVVDPATAARCGKEDELRPRTAVIYRLLRHFGVGIEEGALTAAGGTAPVSLEEPTRATIGLPPPTALPGVEAPRGTAIAVSLLRPAPGLGAELLAPPPTAEDPAPPPAPGRSLLALVPPERSPVPPGHLSNAALELYARCGYRFYAERVLGLRPLELGADGGSGGALAFGTAVHALLEWSARNRWLEPPRERCERALARAGLPPDPERTERARELVGGWLAAPLRAELERSRLAPEAPFLLEIGGAVIRGMLDLLASAPGAGPIVVDYKTNALDGRSPAELMSAYETQRDLYALAAGGGGEEVRTAFVFLERPAEPVVREHGPDELAATRERLEGLVAGIAAERFEVTARPHRALCHDCPARPRLCSHPIEATMADTPPDLPPVEAPRTEPIAAE
jgi:ATP-dependent helicase/nuclease subunit A